MKKLALILLALPLIATPVMAGPFGLSIGQPISELHVLKRGADNSYQVSVPAPDSEFDSYSVFTTGKGAICDVVAVGKNEGNRLLAAYASVKMNWPKNMGSQRMIWIFARMARAAVLIASLAQMPCPLTFHSNCG